MSELHNAASRNTRQKLLISECLQKFEHITADDIIGYLRENGTPVAKSTVYRYLSQLEETGVVKKYFICDGQSACYQYLEKACSQHYHLMCSQCGQIVHFENEKLISLFDKIARENDLFIDGTRTVFYGLCKNCR